MYQIERPNFYVHNMSECAPLPLSDSDYGISSQAVAPLALCECLPRPHASHLAEDPSMGEALEVLKGQGMQSETLRNFLQASTSEYLPAAQGIQKTPRPVDGRIWALSKAWTSRSGSPPMVSWKYQPP